MSNRWWIGVLLLGASLATNACGRRGQGGGEGATCDSNSDCATELFCSAGRCARPNAAPPVAAPTPAAQPAPPTPPALPPEPPTPPAPPTPPEPPPTAPASEPVVNAEPTPPGQPGPDEFPTTAVVGALRDMALAEFVGMIPPEGMQLCDRQAENVGQVFRSPTRGCRTVTAAQVTPAYWRSELRDKVAGSRRVTCEPTEGGERCTTPPIRNDPPHGRVWYLNSPPGQRILRRVISWSIDG
ncbi:MAG: hypothetical protein KA978_24340 [Deltaproteobacteria bacterium]|jgi:hypothetical protein|nr:hypothetical protein [Deltaproteobacteria bacterium]